MFSSLFEHIHAHPHTFPSCVAVTVFQLVFSTAGMLGETISLDVFDHIKYYSSNMLTKTVLFFLAADMGEEFVSMLTELLFELHVAATPDKLNKVSTC